MSPLAKNDPTAATASPSVVSGTDSTVGVAPAASTVEELPRFAPPAAAGELGRLGKYRIQKELGRGGMGAVYLAFDERLERQVALKVMLPNAAANPTAKDRFLREARSAARISSDHVVSIHEADEIDGTPYIALQFLQGYPLDEYLKRKGNPTVPQAIRIARETALGLAAAHKLGLVHRDIKPANLWLEAPGGRVKVLDFGLAKPVNGKDLAELTASGAVVGTPNYMAPEQGMGKAVDGRADLFSLGCVLYRLVTGRLPFERPTLMGILTAIATEEPTPVRELNPAVSEPLADLIHRLMAKKPEQRLTSAKQVADDLDRIAHPPRPAVSSDAPTMTPQVVYVPINVSVEQPNPFENLTDDESDEWEPPTPTPPAKKKWVLPVALVGAGLFALLVAAVAGFIIIRITNKDGTVTEVKVPDGSKVEVSKDGKPVVAVTPDGKVMTPNPRDPVAVPPPVKASVPAAASGLPAGKFGLRFEPKDRAVAVKVPLRPTTVVTVEAWVTFEAVQEVGGGEFIHTPNGNINTDDSRLRVYSFHGHATAGDRIPLGRRVHVAGVNDGKKRYLYLDGKRVAESEDAGIPIPENEHRSAVEKITTIALGSDLFTGTIDAVRVSTVARYDKEFTPPEVFTKDKDTLALYLFDEGKGDTLNDSSGNGYHAKISGAKWMKGVGAVPAGDGIAGLRVDEKDAFVAVEVPTLTLPNDGPLTLEGYVKFDHPRAGENPTFFGWRYQYSVGTSGLGLGTSHFTAGEKGEGWKQNYTRVPDELARGTWHHLAAVRDGRQNRLYINGKLAAKAEVTEAIRPPGSDAGDGLFVLGSVCDGVTLREVRASKAVRYTGDQFAPAARHEPDKDTLALFHCDDGKGDVLTDSSGNKHHGKIIGAKWVTAAADRDRKTAEWVLSVGGKCSLRANETEKIYSGKDTLPTGPCELVNVEITREQASEETASRLVGLSKLQLLSLVAGPLTDTGVAKLRDLPALQYLNLDGTKVTDAGLPALKQLPELKVLILVRTQVTDAGLAELKKIPKLQKLMLDDTAVTDEGLLHLRAIPGLTEVCLLRTKVTEAGVKKLAAALPECKITSDGGTTGPKK